MITLSGLPKGITTRFAPSPTGPLHLGHVAHMIFVWGVARSLNGKVILRMEDHDRTRCRPEYEQNIIEDLDWLGFVPDAGFQNKKPDLYRQSDNNARYKVAIEDLKAQNLIYACDCSRSDIAFRNKAKQQHAVVMGEEQPYDGYCRNRNLVYGPGRGIRFIMPEEKVVFKDVLLGVVEQHPMHQCGDVLLKDRLGNWTYQFAVTVDDTQQGIDLVIRGQDLIESTGRQILLSKKMSREKPPIFLHHPLLLDEGGYKLSKRMQSESIKGMRGTGLTAPEILGRAAHGCGLIPQYTPVSLNQIQSFFNIE